MRIKACAVYSHYNQDHIDELLDIFERDFGDLDRVVFSVVHGSVSDPRANEFNWDKYFKVCDRLERTAVAKNIYDLHSLFTLGLRMAKDNFLKEILIKKNMRFVCGAGRRVVVINEIGDVFPCEPLWHSIGNLRENGYRVNDILNSAALRDFAKGAKDKRCNCHWGLALSNSLLYTPRYYPKILSGMAKIAMRGMLTKRGTHTYQ